MAKGEFVACSTCGAKVRRENLKAHVRRVHGPPQATWEGGGKRAKRAEKERRAAERAQRAKIMVVALLIVLSLVGSALYFLVAGPVRNPDGGGNTNGNGNTGTNPVVAFDIVDYGTFRVELYADQAPRSVANFLYYVDNGLYTNNQFHRVVAGFVIQGGKLNPGDTQSPLAWEDTGLTNGKYTISMARQGSDYNSATSQFFINVDDNTNLDRPAQQYPYAVFGRVVSNTEVVDAIAQAPTQPSPECPPLQQGGYESCQPVTPVIIASVTRV